MVGACDGVGVVLRDLLLELGGAPDNSISSE
jgi:hypothetical protein